MATRSALAMLLVVGMAGCDRKSGSPPPAVLAPPADPWSARLATYRGQYAANQQKLQADWNAALQEAKAGDPDSDRLSHDISDLIEEIHHDRDVLQNWDRELTAELERRGH
jgi:hypothetical protein